MPEDMAFLLGQDSDRVLMLTGWIGEHPGDGRDIAHLLLYPAGHGVAAKMRALADMLRLAPALAGAPKLIPPDVTHVQLADGWARIHSGDSMIVERPVPGEMASVALARQQIVLTVGQDGYTGRPQDLDAYLGRIKRLYMGLVPVE